ncbi:hypothetical protein O181_000193 [Austropuccinia psidii MF-1]|uniref:Uncharacterized protein n=1 Tax=Austropuccinia psidii MF-1 TaxID=1389203 RepID=A0A9Q3GAN7_9BASI|nr:hypothetical protein [Austropuccinia psidii MF-1]
MVVRILCQTFSIFKKLGLKDNELEGLSAQASCHAPPNINQLITAAIISKGKENLLSTFRQCLFILSLAPHNPPNLWHQKATYAAHPSTLLTNLVALAFTAASMDTGKPTACKPQSTSTLSVPLFPSMPGTPDCHTQPGLSSHSQRTGASVTRPVCGAQ